MRRFYLAIAMIATSFVSSTRADEKNSLIGRWDYQKTDSYYVRFFKNGSFRLVTAGTFLEGRYRLLSGGVVELNIVLANRGRRTNEIKYRLDGDTLQLKLEAGWRTFKRAEASDDEGKEKQGSRSVSASRTQRGLKGRMVSWQRKRAEGSLARDTPRHGFVRDLRK